MPPKQSVIDQFGEDFYLLANSISQLAWIADETGWIYWYNDRWYDYTGTKEQDMLGWGWKAVHHEQHVDRVVQHFKTSVESGSSWEDTFPLLSKDGEFRWFLSRAKPVKDEHGKIIRWFGTNTDITEQRELEKKLRDSEKRFRHMADSIDQMIWVTRPDGFHEYYNKRWYEYTGMPEGSTDGEAWNGVFHPEDQTRAWKLWTHSLKTGEPYEIEYRLRYADGSYRWVLGRALPMRNRRGDITKWFGTCTDIHGLKEAEARAEAANKAKSDFLANMSHEIRTPMNAVLGLTNVLVKQNGLPHNVQEMLSTMQVSAQALMELINDLLDISKIETNNIELEAIPVNIHHIINSVMNMLQIKAEEKQLEFTYSPPANQPNQHFVGDPTRIRQILINLISNAVKFTSEGSIHVTYVYKALGEQNYQITVTIKDTGIGISQEKWQQVFEKFTQADTSTTREFGGSGLGLAICKNLAEMMGGDITLKSELGQGSEFVFTIQLPPADAPLAIQKTTEETHLDHVQTKPDERQRVLLVEDYPANVLVAGLILDELGYDHDVVGDGLTALKTIEGSRDEYIAVLMDVQMPQMDGLEVTRRVRLAEQEAGQQPIPIIAMTAHALMQDRERCISAGMNDYISKPFDPEKLRTILKKVGSS